MKDERLNIIFYYLRNKRFTINEMFKCTPPVDYNISILYEIYFNSFIAIIEYITKDLKEKSYKEKFYNTLGSENNYKYIKELRNGFIHRGIDISGGMGLSSGGILLNALNIIVPPAPQIVYSRKNKNGTQKKYTSFTNNLLQLVILCENCNQIIYDFCNDNGLLRFTPTTKEDYITELNTYKHVPDFVKEVFGNFDFTQISKLEQKLFENKIKEYFNTEDIYLKALSVLF